MEVMLWIVGPLEGVTWRSTWGLYDGMSSGLTISIDGSFYAVPLQLKQSLLSGPYS